MSLGRAGPSVLEVVDDVLRIVAETAPIGLSHMSRHFGRKLRI